MAFTVEAGADLYGQKHNMMLTFGQRPSLWEFRSSLEAQFDVKARSCRPAGYPDVPFKVETLQVFGDQGAWVDLLRDDQLRPGCQVWAFQPESIWHSDAQGVIPKPDPQATGWQPQPGSPGRQRAAGTDAGCPPTLVEKMTAVFHEIDGTGKGYLLREDIERAFQRAEIAYQNQFQSADLNRSGHVTWDEWQQFAIQNSSTVDALFFRMKDAPNYSAPPPQQVVSQQPGYPGQQQAYQPAPQDAYRSPSPGYQPQPQASQQQVGGGVGGSFQVEAGSDLYGQKQNMVLSFPRRPALAEFRSCIEAQFDVKARSCRPAGYPDVPFKVETLQVFGDQGAWVDLLREDQLRSGCQVWVFQPESIWHSDAQGVIPKPEAAAQWAPAQGSPARRRAETDTGCPPTLVEKMTAVFHEIDGTGKGYLLREDIQRAFQRAEMQLGDLFGQADLNRSGHVTWDEWQQFAIQNSGVVDALFFRLKDAPNYTAPPPAQYTSQQPGYPGPAQEYRAAPPGTYSSPPPNAPYQPVQGYTTAPAPAYGESPQRQRAQQEYEAARQRADAARIAKEQAEGDERRAWDKLYQTPQ